MMLAAIIKRSSKRMSLVALAVALAASATAQAQSSETAIEQAQLGNVWSDMQVEITG